MNIFLKIVISVMLAGLILTACSNSPERNKAAGESVKGSAQKAAGNLTNDEELKAKGNKNHIKGNLRDTKEDVKDFVKGN